MRRAVLVAGAVLALACDDEEVVAPPVHATTGGSAASAGSPAMSAGSSGSPTVGGASTAGAAGGGGGGGSAGAPNECDRTPTTGAPTFHDATDAWELGPTGVNALGNRFSVSDLDHDGYPDLLLHRISTNARTQLDGATSKNWLLRVLMNRPTADGKGRRFVDATIASGYATVPGSTTELRSAQLATAADVDNDGDLDLFSGTYVDESMPEPGDRSLILLNDGTGTFAPAPTQPFSPYRRPTTGATFTDVDRDGNIDLFIGFFYAPNSYAGYQHELYRGHGDGTFEEATTPAGLQMKNGLSLSDVKNGLTPRPSYGVTSCDLDGDGAPELLVGAYGRQWNALYQNDGTGRFAEIGRASGYAGDDDVSYADNQFFACYCTVKPETKPDCAGVAAPEVECPSPADSQWQKGIDDQPFRANGNTFTTLCADLDGDGKNDVYSAMIHHWWAGKGSDSSQILTNVTPGPGSPIVFEREDDAKTGTTIPHATVDWDEGAIFAASGDLDNDGDTDLLMGETDYPNQFAFLYVRQADGTYVDQAGALGVTHPCASGMAIADFDRDGDLDLLLGAGTARDCSKQWSDNFVKLYENDASQVGGYVAIRLKGDGHTANAAGIGARVTVKTGGRAQTQEIGGGYGHMAMQDDTVAFFGLGACTTLDEVTVRWPTADGATETFTDVPANAFVELAQGSQAATKILP